MQGSDFCGPAKPSKTSRRNCCFDGEESCRGRSFVSLVMIHSPIALESSCDRLESSNRIGEQYAGSLGFSEIPGIYLRLCPNVLSHLKLRAGTDERRPAPALNQPCEITARSILFLDHQTFASLLNQNDEFPMTNDERMMKSA